MVEYASEAAQLLSKKGILAEVINMRFVKPMDFECLDDIANHFRKVVTIEESSLVGGFGTGVLEYFAEKGYKSEVLRIGLPDHFIEHGTQKELHAMLGIDPKGIADKTTSFVRSGLNKGVAV